jgi:hypothetical protein
LARGKCGSFIITSSPVSGLRKKLPLMPCTAGEVPVTIDRLFGLVKVGTALWQWYIRPAPGNAASWEYPLRYAIATVVGHTAIDADDNGRALGELVSTAIHGHSGQNVLLIF